MLHSHGSLMNDYSQENPLTQWENPGQRLNAAFMIAPSQTHQEPTMPRFTPADYLFAIAFGLAIGALVGFGI